VRVSALEATLAETTSRLDTRSNQLKFLQDSARDQLQSFKTTLAEASSRLETRDDELRRLLDMAQERILALESAQTETSDRIENGQDELTGLQSLLAEQAQQLDAYRAAAAGQFEATGNRIVAQEKKLEFELRLRQNLFEDVQAQLRRQRVRLGWVMAIAGVALVLAAIVAVVFHPA